MSGWAVLVSESARKEFYCLEKEMQPRLKKAFAELGENPFQSRPKADIKKLQGPSNPAVYRLRVGSYRVLYSVEGKEVKISRIIAREKGYKWL